MYRLLLNKKVFFLLSIIFFSTVKLSSQSPNISKILPPGHWIYEALDILQAEQKITSFNENSMMTVGEIQFWFNKINKNELSEQGDELYEKCQDFFTTNTNLLQLKSFDFDIKTVINTELYYKGNENIPWSFNYNYVDNFANFPIYIDFSKYIAIESHMFVGKTHYGASKSDNFSNLPIKNGDIEFYFPRFAYGSASYVFDDWGINAHIGKEGFQIGNTKLGSIIYNKSFETDSYINMNVFSNYMKYSVDIVQITNKNWLYLHDISIKPHKTFKFALLEGSMVNAPFEIRYINPLMIMHQYSGWTEYGYDEKYSEDHFCAYFCGLFDWNPIKYLRIYGLYSQIEFQLPTEQGKEEILKPDSLGGQLGFEITIPSKAYEGWWKTYVEAAYTSPYLYVKQTPYSSLIRVRKDNLIDDKIYSWIGLPDGPDTFEVLTGIDYQSPDQYFVKFNYLFKIKGPNDYNMMDNMDKDQKIYTYYPYADYQSNKSDDNYNKAYHNALRMWPSENERYSHSISLEGGYTLSEKSSISTKAIYTWQFGNSKDLSSKDNGIEIDFSFKYNLF